MGRNGSFWRFWGGINPRTTPASRGWHFLACDPITPISLSSSSDLLLCSPGSFCLSPVNILMVTLGPLGFSRIPSASRGSFISPARCLLSLQVTQSQALGLAREHLRGSSFDLLWALLAFSLRQYFLCESVLHIDGFKDLHQMAGGLPLPLQ